MYDMKSSVLTIRLDPKLGRQLAQVAKRTGRSRSEVVRDAVQRQLALAQFQDLRRRIMPLAEARGYLTDEDVFRDVSLTYALPNAAARRVGAQRASLTVAGHNLGFLWKPDYKGLDPEVNFSGDNGPTGSWAFTRVDYWTMPMTRRFTAALEFSF